jgi:hypothetical protein
VLESLTVDDFRPAVGEPFVLAEAQLELELTDARTFESGAPAVDGDGRRTQFSLLFRGPHEPRLPQRIYRLEHATLGALEIFIVPVARDAAGMHYEAIFT